MNEMSETRESFDGFVGGAIYDFIARLTGYGPSYYRRAANAIPLQPGMTLLDLGCGTASLSLAVSKRMEGRGRIIGIDLSERQLKCARKKIRAAAVPIDLHHGSIRDLPCDNSTIDGIFVSQVLHALPEDVLTATLTESSRVLRQDGFFALIEWSRPRLGYTAAVWSVTLLKERNSPNWRGTYPEIFRDVGFHLVTDVYLDSLNRCQVFVMSG